MVAGLVLMVSALMASGSLQAAEADDVVSSRVTVVTTLFPVFDFVRHVGGDKVEAVLIVPPGVEPHEYSPSPQDIVRINGASAFLYTSDAMEPWVSRLLPGITNQNLLIAQAGQDIDGGEEDAADHPTDGEWPPAGDPHIWLDFANAQKMVDNVLDVLVTIDGENAGFYQQNAAALKTELADLDFRYREGLRDCRLRTIVYGGHFAFGYLAKRYELEHVSPYQGFSPNAEPTPRAVGELIGVLSSTGAKTIFFEELVDPKIARVIAEETGARQVLLSAAHNVTRDEMDAGVTFIQIMNDNLAKLREGLECR